MDYWSALDLLGLDDDDALTRERVRRTYMRKLREHPPEKDPEGFQRLREAYEALRHHVPEGERVVEEAPARVEVVEAPAPAPEVELPGINVGALLDVMPLERPSLYSFKREDEPAVEQVGGPIADELPGEVPRVAEAPPVEAAPEPDEVARPALALADLVDKLLVLLQHDEVDEAIAIEDEWRRHGDSDDHRRASDDVALRWALTRDLLTVAPMLPVVIVRALAKGIAAHDVASAGPALVDFRMRAPKTADEVNTLLATRAPDLHKHVRDALYVAPPLPRPAPRPRPYTPITPATSSSSSGRGSLWFLVPALALFARLAASGDCSGSHSSYRVPEVKIDPELLRYHPPDFSKLDLAPPAPPAPGELDTLPPLDPTASRDRLLGDITFEITELTLHHVLTAKQQQLVDSLQSYVYADMCPRMRPALARVETSGIGPAALQYVKPIRERVDIVCPAPAKKKKA